LAALLSLACCGYSLVGRGTALPPDVRSIRIPVFANATGQPEVETVVTGRVKDKFIQDGRLSVVEGPAADSALHGVIEKYELKPLSYDSQNNVTQYLAEIVVSVTHSMADSGRVLARRKVDTKEVFKVDASVAGSESQRMAALNRAADAAAISILSLVVEAF